MGTSGYKELMDERRENYKLLKDEMCKVAEKYGERVLETKNNPISIGNFFFFFFFFCDLQTFSIKRQFLQI